MENELDAPNRYFPDYLPPTADVPICIACFFKDEEGHQIFHRWAAGLGNWEDAPFGEYLMKSNPLKGILQEKVIDLFKNYDGQVDEKRHYDETFHVELPDNGYRTGYELLHGTNASVGDFKMKGNLVKKGAMCFDGIFQYTWNDVIDPNPQYKMDMFLYYCSKIFFAGKPKNYTIRINFSSKFHAQKKYSFYWRINGFPGGNAQ